MNLLLLLANTALSDPCGMVPPIGAGLGVIQRDGAQRTYVMHSQGTETIALRPGFVGSVEEFGMLIPFPSVPELRKLDDQAFAHIEGAITPPKMQIQIQDYMMDKMDYEMVADMPLPEPKAEEGLSYNQVAVVKEEAVGMYQVAVLQAGSPKALARWMQDNSYQYPQGMDAVVSDYVNEGWCFVAVKAKVGSGPGVSPAPGLRSVNPDRPAGSAFDGYVQGMGFRFASERAVVPMRLSVFNGEDPRNVIYMLTDSPVKLKGAGEELVVRQISGEQLHQNLTQPIERVFSGGTYKDVKDQLPALEPQRNPALYNGVARDLFASDLLAVRTGQLALEHEETEKELLSISEAMGLRGTEIDAMHAQQIAAQRAVAVDGALDDIKEMHLSVIDGVLPGELLASENLSFVPYEMPGSRNVDRSDPITPVGPFVTLWKH